MFPFGGKFLFSFRGVSVDLSLVPHSFELLCFYEAGTSRREFYDLFGDHALCIKPSVCLQSLTGLTHIFNRLGTSTLDYTFADLP